MISNINVVKHTTFKQKLRGFLLAVVYPAIFLASLALLLFLSSGCSKEDSAPSPNKIVSNVDGITFRIGAAGIASTAPGTKSVAPGTRSAVAESGAKPGVAEAASESLSEYDERFEVSSELILGTPGGAGKVKSPLSGSPSEQSSHLKYSGERNYTVTIAGSSYKYESINWEEGDEISIGMANLADNAPYDFIDFRITGVTPSDPGSGTVQSRASIETSDYSVKGLRWSAGDGEENISKSPSPFSRLEWDNAPLGASFFAFWPKLSSGGRVPTYVSTYPSGSGNHGLTTRYTIPETQYCTLDGGVSGTKLYRPDMTYAHMVASDIVYGSGSDVRLTFYPEFTAFEFILKNETSTLMQLKSVTLSSLESYLAGDFMSNCHIENTPSDKGFYREIHAGSSNSRSVTLKFKEGTAVKDYVDLGSDGLQFTILAGAAGDSFKGKTSGGITSLGTSCLTACSVLLEMRVSTDGGVTWSDAYRQLDLRCNQSGEDNGSDWVKIPTRSKVVITNVSVPESVSKGLLQKEFSVSPSKSVYFSPGNLQAMPNGLGTASSWRFAPRQYDYCSDFDYSSTSGDNGFSSSNTHWMDLFAWSGEENVDATKWGIGNSGASDTGFSSGYATSDYKGKFVDWGTNLDLISQLGSGWYTLSMSEWRYILGNQDIFGSSAYTGGIENMPCRKDANIKRGLATVGKVKGLVILPDEWTLPRNCKFEPTLSSFDVNTYSIFNASGHSGSWSAMEQAGAVFLPAAGFRRPARIPPAVRNSQQWITQMCSDYKLASSGNREPLFNVLNVMVNRIDYNDFGLGNGVGSINNAVYSAARSVRLVKTAFVFP